MARKKVLSVQSEFRHGQCANLAERYNRNYKGELICGRCPNSKFAFLLSEPACDKFVMRRDEKGEKGKN